MTTVTGWAVELAQKMVTDALDALGPVSVAAQLLRLGLVLNFDRHAIVSAPGFTATAGNAGFVAEGMPIPVRQLAAVGAQLLPYKLASIAVLTREMIESSNAEQMIADVLVRSAGMALDAAFFDACRDRRASCRYQQWHCGVDGKCEHGPDSAFFEDMHTVVDASHPLAARSLW